MSEYFVAGGSYQDIAGNEYFALVCPSNSELPYVMIDNLMRFFVIWQNAHLYRIEADYTLSLVALSPDALEWGIKAPKKVLPDVNLLKKIQSAINQGIPSGSLEEISLSNNMSL